MSGLEQRVTGPAEIGRPRRAIENGRLVRGQGHYVADFRPDGLTHLVFVRSIHAHARLLAVDPDAARHAPGVLAVLTAADLPPEAAAAAGSGTADLRTWAEPWLAAGEVFAVGAPIAAVVAETEAQAADAAQLVAVDYEPLPAVAEIEAALATGATLVHPEFGTNVAFTLRRGQGDVAAAMAGAARSVSLRIEIPRLAGMPMEPLGVLAEPAREGQPLVIHCTTQAPWRVHAAVAGAVGLPADRVRVIAPDVGGGFGVRGPVYVEYLVTALAAQRLGRAVRWVATRSEDFLVTQGSRETIVEATLAATASGRFVALQVQAWTNVGAYASAPGPAQRLVSLLTGAYDIPVAAAEVSGVYTNTPPTGAYRGAGRPEASYVIERLVEAMATTLGMDAIALRRRNFIPPDAFPYRTPLGTTYDSGDYATALDRALALADATDGAPPTGGADSELWGIGVASYIEPTGGGWESGRLWVEPDGRVVVVSGSVPQGQSHATTFAQIVADRLGVRFDDVSVRQGDTADGLPGIGTFGSRSTALGGSALAVVADEVYGRARQIAAHLLEAAPEDVVARAGRFSIVGVTASERSVSWTEVAAAAASGRLPAGLDPNLDARTRFDMGGEAFASGTCVAVVSVERTTGVIRLRRLVLVHDCGVAVNPRLVEAQLHGGLAQGVGEALGEWLRCGDDGQVLAGSLLDYWLPHADDLPFFELDAVVSPSPINPLGVKGVGEAGTIAAPTAILHAALAALRPIGVTALDLPLTSERLWRAVSGR